MRITFLGATGTVTGSKYLVETSGQKILIDCGLFQGFKELRLRNWAKLPLEAKELDAIILSHAHIDHSGYIPLLVKQGFKGPIYCTPGTYQLCKLLLPDSGFLQEEDARYANLHGYSKHRPALPLYTKEDADKSLQYFETVDFNERLNLANDIETVFQPAGHIIGAAIVQLKHKDKTITFSGDLGRPHDPVMQAPTFIKQSNYLLIESTYGNRRHDPIDPIDQLEGIIKRTLHRGGKIIIPSFAVGRAQSILYYLYELINAKRIPPIPIFLDSPMAIDAIHIFAKFYQETRLSKEMCKAICSIANYISTPDESKALASIQHPAIIIAASGMATGGRILHHLKTFGPQHKNTILFSGFQAAGTRGEALVNGKRELKLLGEIININAEVVSLTNTSAHADYYEIIDWLKHFTTPPKKTFITHGEPGSAYALQQRIIEELGWDCSIPHYLQTEYL